MLPLSSENRAGAGVEAGQEIDVDIEHDDAPRTVEVPDDLAAALGGPARAAFDALSVSRQRAIVDPIEAAKTPETRARRIAKAVDELGVGSGLSAYRVPARAEPPGHAAAADVRELVEPGEHRPPDAAGGLVVVGLEPHGHPGLTPHDRDVVGLDGGHRLGGRDGLRQHVRRGDPRLEQADGGGDAVGGHVSS